MLIIDHAVREAAKVTDDCRGLVALYIFFFGGLFGRYGSSDLVVMLALLRLFDTVVEVLPSGSPRLAVIDRATVEALGDGALNTAPAQPKANSASR